MADPTPTIRVKADPCNPGEFFACCGLLELADRLWDGAEGWFTEGWFQVVCAGTIDLLLAMLVMDPPEEVTRLENGLDVKALIAPLRFSFDGGASTGITLDAWLTIKREKGKVAAAANPPWNFWSGQQTSLRIWAALRAALAKQLMAFDPANAQDVFAHRVLLPGRFGFDPGAAWNALDVGFSPNEQKIEVASSAVVELLAAVGLQRFRPQMSDDRGLFVYATWGQPLGPAVAAAAAAGVVRVFPSARFRGRVVSRGSYAALGYSSPLRGGPDE
jgi:CRISPR-associated protein Csx14